MSAPQVTAWNTTGGGNDAIFDGTPAAIPISSAGVVVKSLQFKVTGYSIKIATGASPAEINFVSSTSNTIEVTNAGDVATLNVPLQGSTGYRKTGAGTLVLTATANSTITGAVSVNGGVLELTTGGAIGGTSAGAGDVTLNGGSLRNSDSAGTSHTFLTANRSIIVGASGGTIDAVTEPGLYSGTIGGTGVLTKVGAGEFRYQGTGLPNTTFQKLVVTDGLYRLGFTNGVEDERGFGAVPASELTDAITLDGGSIAHSFNPITLNANRGITVGPNGGAFAGGSMTIPGPLSGTGTLTISAGTITLTNPGNVATFDGALAMASGAVLNLNESLDAASFTGTGGTVSVASGKALTVGAGNTNASFGGVISGAGGLTKTGTGTQTLTNAANSYSGPTTINQGTIAIDSDANLGDGTGTVNLSGGTLNTSGSRSVSTAPVANPINVTADSSITTTSAATTVNLNLSSDNISGSAGTLTFRNDGANDAGDVFEPRFSGSGFDFSRPIVIDNGAVGSTRLNSFNTVGTTQTFSGNISGTGSYNRTVGTSGVGGTTIFTGDNTYTGGTTINSGTLVVNNTTGSGTGSGQVIVNSGGTLAGTGTIITPAGITVNAGGKLTGTLTFGAASNPTSLIFNGGTLAPGTSPGTITLAGGGAVVFNSATVLDYDLNGSDNAVGAGVNDLLDGVGDLTLGGVLNVTDVGPTNSFASASIGTSWRLINYDPMATFIDNGLTLGNMPALGSSLKFAIDTSILGQVNLTIQSVPEASALVFGGLITSLAGIYASVRSGRRRMKNC